MREDEVAIGQAALGDQPRSPGEVALVLLQPLVPDESRRQRDQQRDQQDVPQAAQGTATWLAATTPKAGSRLSPVSRGRSQASTSA